MQLKIVSPIDRRSAKLKKKLKFGIAGITQSVDAGAAVRAISASMR
jgi:hypothetical protein